jgi:hypothetical protein
MLSNLNLEIEETKTKLMELERSAEIVRRKIASGERFPALPSLEEARKRQQRNIDRMAQGGLPGLGKRR